MTYLGVQIAIKRKRPAFIAGAALFLTSAMSISGFNIFESRFGFEFLPLLVLLIWPRRAHTVLSLIIVWSAGLFTDWATGDITGQWALIFILIWGFLRPEMRRDPFAPVSLFFVWLLICLIAILVSSVSGYFIHGIMPDLSPLGRQMSLATLVLPVILILRRAVIVRLKDFEDWG